METFCALLTLRVGSLPVTGEYPSQRPVTRSFDVFFDLRLNKRLSKQSRRRCFETLQRSLWRHCNATLLPSKLDCQWLHVAKMSILKWPTISHEISRYSNGLHIEAETNGRHFADDIFKCILANENVRIPIKMSLKCVPKGPINIIPAMFEIMAWRRPGDKPLSEAMLVSLPTHLCVTRPQWVNIKVWQNYPLIYELVIQPVVNKTHPKFGTDNAMGILRAVHIDH